MTIEVDPDWWKTLFDEVYLLTDARSVCDPEITKREVDVICELLPIQEGHRVLDLCGGQGRHSVELCSRGIGGCTVLDYSNYLIDYGRKQALHLDGSISFIQADARDTGLPSESFDHLLIMGNSLGYLPDPDDDRRILAEAHRLLKPGGCILIDVTDGESVKAGLNPNAWHEIGDDIVVCRERELIDDTIHAREVVISKDKGIIREGTYAIRLYEPETLAALVTDAGFGHVKIITDFSPREGEGDYGCMNHRMIVTARKP
jgi:D-alanine-D-alanine ligase